VDRRGVMQRYPKPNVFTEGSETTANNLPLDR
jgi:hypothetical protein